MRALLALGEGRWFSSRAPDYLRPLRESSANDAGAGEGLTGGSNPASVCRFPDKSSVIGFSLGSTRQFLVRWQVPIEVHCRQLAADKAQVPKINSRSRGGSSQR